jgi:hypothetical protein
MPMNITWTFSPGAIIFASRFNTNFSDVKNWADAHEIATTGVHGAGAGTLVSTAANNSFTGTNNFSGITTFNSAVDLRSPNYISNARLTLSAGVLRLVGENGSNPSVSNPVYIRRVNSVGATAGSWETITFTSVTNCVIQDATSVDSYFYNGVSGTPWGTTTTVAWGSRLPLFIYLATETLGTNPCLFFSRYPNLQILPAATGIGYANNPPAIPAETNVFAWTASNVTATHAGQFCDLIGYVEAVKSSVDDWTFQTLSNISGGIQNYNFEKKTYDMPTGQNGAASGSYFAVTAGTAPTYTTSNSFTYKVDRTGKCSFRFSASNAAGGTAGAGGSQLQLMAPYNAPNFIAGQGVATNAGTPRVCFLFSLGSFAQVAFVEANASGITYISGADQNNVARSVTGSFIFNI